MGLPRKRLLLIDLLGLLVEGASIAVPAYFLYGTQPEVVAGQVPGTAVLQLGAHSTRPVLLLGLLFAVAYFLWQARFLGRLRDRAGPLPIEQLYRLASELPRQSLIIRPLLWLCCGVVYTGWLTTRGLPAGSQLQILWLFLLNPVMTGALHSLACDRLLWGQAWRELGEHPSDLRRFAGRFTVELGRATLLCTALALLLTLAFLASEPFNLEQFQQVHRYLPGLLLVLLFAAYRYSSAQARPIRRYLERTLGQGGADKALAARAYQAAQALPYRLGGAMVAASLLSALVLLVLRGPLLDLTGELLVLIVGLALSVTTAASLYAIIWHRFTLRTLLGHLRAQYAFHPDEVPAPLSLAGKMVYGFGLPVICVCVLSLLWSFVQYKTLANHHIQRLARDRMETLRDELLRDLVGAPTPSSEDVIVHLRRHAAAVGLGRECFVYYFVEDQPDAVLVSGPVGQESSLSTPRLPTYSLLRQRQRAEGTIDLPQLDLTGTFEHIRLGGRALGALIVLYPNYRHPGLRGPDNQADPLHGQLLGLVIFFIVLIFVSVGVVVIAAMDLSRPLRYLERRAAAMAQGDLTSPVIHTAVEVDEVGSLTFAFEEMRKALRAMLTSSAEMNQQLEAEVARRTMELSRRNREVSEAMTQLEQARGDLLRTEKLATMGRIAAGVTSEINNPVSAMVTIPDPLAEEIGELGRLAEERPLRRERIVQTLRELRKMTDVLRRSAQRAKEIVQATRIYSRIHDDRIGVFDLGRACDEVFQLFGDLQHWGVLVRREVPEGLSVLSARGDLGQLLSGWLARRAPRLRERAGAEISLVARRLVVLDGPRQVEVLLSDTGPALPDGEIQPILDELGPLGQIEIGSATDDRGPCSWLRLRLPLAPADAEL